MEQMNDSVIYNIGYASNVLSMGLVKKCYSPVTGKE